MTPFTKRVLGWSTAAVVAASAGIIGAWEGMRTHAYLDVANIPTICYGSTKGVRLGDTKTESECLELLSEEIAEHYRGVKSCVTRHVPLHVTVALTSLAYNVGVPRFCSSTLVRLINQGAPPEVYCQQFDRWVYVNGKVVRGLENRRRDEKQLCLGSGRWMPRQTTTLSYFAIF